MPGGASKGKAREDKTNTTTGSTERDMPEGGSSSAPDDNWAKEKDPNKRRRIQNKLAQRKFRERSKQEKEDRQRETENTERAGLTYANSDVNNMDPSNNLDGVPWGGYNIRYPMELSKSEGRPSDQSSAAGSSPNTGYGRGSGSR